MERYEEFEQYLRAEEPDKVHRAKNWSIAIGLQDVDRIHPSDFLLQQAKENIEGNISREQVRKNIEEYYKEKSIRDEAIKNRTFEADNVIERINSLLAEPAFTFSPAELSHIHEFLFKGLDKRAGTFRDYNITKNQWILDGDTIKYGRAGNLKELLNFDFSVEKRFDYTNHSSLEALNHIARFIAGIWQIHPFGEGNTRTTAVFLIKYLKSFGFNVDNESFAKHSWFFRNALVRSQYENIPKGIHRTFEPLERFLNHAVFGMPADLRNRTLHIHWKKDEQINEMQHVKPQNEVLRAPKPQNEVLEKQILTDPQIFKGFEKKLTIKEFAVITLIAENNRISLKELAAKPGLSKGSVDRIIKSLKEKGILQRLGSKNNSTWIVKSLCDETPE